MYEYYKFRYISLNRGVGGGKSLSQRSTESADSCISLISSNNSSPSATLYNQDRTSSPQQGKTCSTADSRPYSITSKSCVNIPIVELL